MRLTYHDARILVVDDEERQLELMRFILQGGGYRRVRTERDPTAATTAFLEFEPDLVLLDLHMPGMGGVEVLERLQALISADVYLPIVVVSGDLTLESRRRALDVGARDFVTKPYDADEILIRIRNLLETRSLYDDLRDHSLSLESAVRMRTGELLASRLEVVERLAVCAEFRDDVTGSHTRRVGGLSASIAAALGAHERTVELLGQAAQLHDIGKIGIPDAILNKPGPLSEEEFEVMKTHAEIGARILANGRSDLIRMAERVALSHHERWDGSGYPHGLAGEGIPLVARIVSVADVVDALKQDRPYREAWPEERVLAYIEEQRGRLFDPRIAEVFLRLRAHGASGNGRPTPLRAAGALSPAGPSL